MSDNTDNELRCKVCGKLASEDCHFYRKSMLCNKHYIQMHRYGKTLDETQSLYDVKVQGICSVCGATDSKKYYIWQKGGEMFGKELCSRHYTQMLNHNKITDATYIETITKNPTWSDEEINILTECYKKEMPIKEIANLINRTEGSIKNEATRLGLTKENVRKNSCNFKAIYQDYDWCYQKFVVERKSFKEMAEEAGTSKRTIEKWCSEKHRLNLHTLRSHIKLNDNQRELIMFSLLGDGHIDKRENEPLFIVTHAENQKDYLYWKYDILKSLCNKEPSVIPATFKTFHNKEIYCQQSYRLTTKTLDDLAEIRSMSKSDIINNLNEFGLAIHFLDDGCYSSCDLWELCYASFSENEKDLYIQILKDKFGLEPRKRKDERYLGFGKEDSKIITDIILRNIPNDLDIIKCKIFKDKGGLSA